MCCGNRRSALRTPPPPARASATRDFRLAGAASVPASATMAAVILQYAGPSAVRVKGPVSGRSYDFSAAHPAQAVDARDAPALTRSGVFSRA